MYGGLPTGKLERGYEMNIREHIQAKTRDQSKNKKNVI